MKKLLLTFVLLMGFGMGSLFAGVTKVMPLVVETDNKLDGVITRSNLADGSTDMTYNSASGQYVTKQVHSGRGYLKTRVWGTNLNNVLDVEINGIHGDLKSVTTNTQGGYKDYVHYFAGTKTKPMNGTIFAFYHDGKNYILNRDRWLRNP